MRLKTTRAFKRHGAERNRVRVALSAILQPTRAQVANLTPEERAVWARIRRDVDEASAGGEFDIRHVLMLDGPGLDAWTERRHEWVAGLLAGDPRVVDDGDA